MWRLASVAFASLVVVASTTAAPMSPASLRVVDERPLTVAGSGFAPRERVAVRLDAHGRWSRSVSALRSGAFRVRFPVSIGCDGYSLHAFGSRGSRARLVSGIRACVPELPDR
jgi:hypothetical protein